MLLAGRKPDDITRASRKGPADWFTGSVRIDPRTSIGWKRSATNNITAEEDLTLCRRGVGGQLHQGVPGRPRAGLEGDVGTPAPRSRCV
jgi:hypothetical protein